MYFKKLELFGFKSFADKTVLNFEPGITAVVGPNGCGKSNVFDAIRWVLGEQSIKELRGSAMEDVIFNGTEKKPSLGFAEVSLTFSNTTRALPIEYDEVTITRRLFRSGESEYLLNKTVVRLKDINELLMGTGIGAEAYSLIQQGKVDLIVNAKPEDRRMLLDEAAGITKYKAKKKEALNKLKDTDNNLLRVNDIIIEVKRQISSIERQANKARKYKEEFEKLKDLEVKSAKYQVESYTKQKNTIDQCIADYQAKEIKLNQELEEINNLLTNEINYLGEIEQKINDLHAEEIKLGSQIDLNNRQIGFSQERLEGLTENERKLNEQKIQLIKRCREQQEKIEALKVALVNITEAIAANEFALNERQDGVVSLERLLKEARQKIKDHEEKILNLTSQQVNIRNELTDIMKEVQGALARKRRLEIENEKVSSEKQEIDQKLQNVDGQISALQVSIRDLLTDKENRNQGLTTLRTNLEQLQKTIDDLERKKLFLISQKEFIEKMHTQYHDIPDPVVEGRFITSSKPMDHHTGIIGKVKQVLSIDGQNLFEIICETKFIELDPQQISLKIEEITQEVNVLTQQEQELTLKIQEQSDGFQQVEEEIRHKEKAFSVLEAQRRDIIEEIKKIIGELEFVTIELDEIKGSLGDVKKKEDELNYKLDTINQEIAWCKNDIKERQDWITVKLQEKEEKIIAITQLQAEIEANKEKFKNQQENLTMFSESLDQWLEEIKRIDDELTSQEDKRRQYVQEIDDLTKKNEEVKATQESLKGILSDYENQKSDLGARINSLRANTSSFDDEIEKIKQDIHVQELKQQQLGFGEKEIKDRLLQAYKLNYEEIVTTLPTATENQEEVNWDQLMQEIEVLRKRCDSFGSVNLVAIEEYEEMKQRFEFLTKQQSDLLEAKSQLMNTITKINRSTRQMFMDTFTKVSEEFRIYFRMLFGGGEAQLVLLDPENVLESGIDIIARPTGKKLQNISLLSGGEKTLTAIALIFGVFKVNPSPFCVLDEIDAALDESNVGRFSYLLQDFSKIAQFIVITHNKKTIASADVMYGITMPETGISRIVSVKFSDEKKNKEQEVVAVGA